MFILKYRNTNIKKGSLQKNRAKAKVIGKYIIMYIIRFSEHMIESLQVESVLECKKDDDDHQKVPHCQERAKELNLLNYFDDFFIRS